MPGSSDSIAHRRVQYAALPYRQRQDGEVQVRLITSRETRRWVIPKGWPMKGLPPHKAAAREAFEEAGLLGSTSRNAIGMYTYEKRLSPQRSLTCDVMVFPMRVKRYLKKWPERSQRIGFWFTIESAAAAVQEEELRDLILRFGAAMAARYAEAQAANAVASEELEAEETAGPPAKAKAAKAKAETKEKPAAKQKAAAKAKAAEKAEEKPKAAAKPKVTAKPKPAAKAKSAAKAKAPEPAEAPLVVEAVKKPKAAAKQKATEKTKPAAKANAPDKPKEKGATRSRPPEATAPVGQVLAESVPDAKAKPAAKGKTVAKEKAATKGAAGIKGREKAKASSKPKATKSVEVDLSAAVSGSGVSGSGVSVESAASAKKKGKRSSGGITLH